MDSGWWLVVPAAGFGRRMQSGTAKQYLSLGVRSMLEITLSRFIGLTGLQGAVVCLAKDDEMAPRLLADFTHFPLHFIQGGAERSDSVRAALHYLAAEILHEQDCWVAVHDAARPCVHPQDVVRLFRAVQTDSGRAAGGLLAVPVRDTLKRADSAGFVETTISRDRLFHALTPQLFTLSTLRSAMNQAHEAGECLTDEASAMEFFGRAPLLVEGRADNIKVTHPEDLPLARLILLSQGVIEPQTPPDGGVTGASAYV